VALVSGICVCGAVFDFWRRKHADRVPVEVMQHHDDKLGKPTWSTMQAADPSAAATAGIPPPEEVSLHPVTGIPEARSTAQQHPGAAVRTSETLVRAPVSALSAGNAPEHREHWFGRGLSLDGAAQAVPHRLSNSARASHESNWCASVLPPVFLPSVMIPSLQVPRIVASVCQSVVECHRAAAHALQDRYSAYTSGLCLHDLQGSCSRQFRLHMPAHDVKCTPSCMQNMHVSHACEAEGSNGSRSVYAACVIQSKFNSFLFAQRIAQYGCGAGYVRHPPQHPWAPQATSTAANRLSPPTSHITTIPVELSVVLSAISRRQLRHSGMAIIPVGTRITL
jgi:hypothetical protein